MRCSTTPKNPLPASSLIINIGRGVVWVIGGSIILQSCFGINPNALVTALGVGGVALSLGLQDTLSNLIGGIQMTLMGVVRRATTSKSARKRAL